MGDVGRIASGVFTLGASEAVNAASGGGLFGGRSGLPGGGDIAQSQAAAAQQAAQAKEIFSAGRPLREQSTLQLLQALEGGTPQFLRGPLQQQRLQERQLIENLIQGGVRGGALQESLADARIMGDLQIGRAHV